METKQKSKHLQKALSEEPIFVLMARDPQAPRTIVEWIKNSLLSQPPEKLQDALNIAINMAKENEKIRIEVEKKNKEDRTFRTDSKF
jgi:hypothetical protein